MGQIRLGIGVVNITGYLIAVARKTTTPLVIEAQESWAPPHPATRNVVVPAVGDIDPVIYYVDFYESANGTSFDLLLSQFVYDLKNKIIVSERRFYRVGSGNPIDPDPDQKILIDPYLDGKTISGVFKEGYRYLRPQTEPVPEWIPHTGGGIELQDPLQFSQDETYTIEISYLADQTTGGGSSGMYSGVQLIDTDTTLDVSYRNNRLRCEAGASNKLVVTLESVASVTDGTFYHFTSNGGLQNQTRILPAGSETIVFNGENYTEMSFGKGEYLRIVKVGSIWEAELAHPFILQVGERFSGTWKDHPSCKPEEAGTLYDGDEWPRIWWWIKNKLPSTHYITDDAVIGGGYSHPLNRIGQIVIHSSLKKFRLPSTRILTEKGLNNFINYGADTDRSYDYPGGYQADQVGELKVKLNKGNGYAGSGANPDWFGPGDASHPQDGGYDEITVNADKENWVKNFGVIYLRRF